MIFYPVWEESAEGTNHSSEYRHGVCIVNLKYRYSVYILKNFPAGESLASGETSDKSLLKNDLCSNLVGLVAESARLGGACEPSCLVVSDRFPQA
jgi:hypothetical protein